MNEVQGLVVQDNPNEAARTRQLDTSNSPTDITVLLVEPRFT